MKCNESVRMKSRVIAGAIGQSCGMPPVLSYPVSGKRRFRWAKLETSTSARFPSHIG